MYTYADPAICTGPMLEFMAAICRMGASSRLPIGICWNDVPREVRYNAERWDRFEQRVRDGRVLNCMIVQFSAPGMTMHSFSGDVLSPFSMTAQFVPGDGVPAHTRNSCFEMVRASGVARYPSNLHLKLDTATFGTVRNADAGPYLELFDTLSVASNAAFACVEEGVMHPDYGTIPAGPEFFDDRSLIENLDSRVPNVCWRMLLGPEHLERLGGRDTLIQGLSTCRVQDMPSQDGPHLLIELTDDPDDLDERLLQEYRPFFGPLL